MPWPGASVLKGRKTNLSVILSEAKDPCICLHHPIVARLDSLQPDLYCEPLFHDTRILAFAASAWHAR